jgi:hypothetical protein
MECRPCRHKYAEKENENGQTEIFHHAYQFLISEKVNARKLGYNLFIKITCLNNFPLSHRLHSGEREGNFYWLFFRIPIISIP